MSYTVQLVDAKVLARELGIAQRTLHRWRKAGLPCLKQGHWIRFDRAKVYKWIEKTGRQGDVVR